MTTNREQIVQELEALQGLVNHPGWEVLKTRIKAQADSQLGAMRNSSTSDVLLRHTYTYMAMTDLIEAPAVLIRTLAQLLQNTKK